MQCQSCERDLYADASAYLCQPCTARLSERLLALPGLYDELAAYLALGSRKASEPIGRTKAAHAPLPLSLDVLDLRAGGGIVGVLEDWRAALHSDLSWSAPVLTGGYPQRVRKAVDGLVVNLPWIASSWPEAGQFATEIRDLHASAISIVAPKPKTLRVGTCTAPVEDGTECGAVLKWAPGDAGLTCRWCLAEYEPHTWLDLVVSDPERKSA